MLHPLLESWINKQGWKLFPFQLETFDAYANGNSGLIHAPTGYGKTLSAFFGPLSKTLNDQMGKPELKNSNALGCKVIWLTPLKALANDTLQSLRKPIEDLNLNLSVDIRTGDTSSYRKRKLREQLPYCLITTPESLSLLLTYSECREKFSSIECIIIDEWHELIGNKRGVQSELIISRLKRWSPTIKVWALSATLGNMNEAAAPLKFIVGNGSFQIIASDIQKQIEIKTLLPEKIDNFPWSGHIGTRLAPKVLKIIEESKTSLIFTNTRAQTEIWYQELISLKPSLENQIAIHHGSLTKDIRSKVEDDIKEGRIRCVVCTSSLDLGVDFSPVDHVIQVGSPKGIARLIQRAGRSGHRPGEVSKLTCVPTNALELIEFAAAKKAWDAKDIENRLMLDKPIDVLAQHIVTLIIGQPIKKEDLRREIVSNYSYRKLSHREWDWVIDFITNGGSLKAYPQYQKAILDDDYLSVTDKKVIQLHRMNIGTITSSSAITVKYQTGLILGTVEEYFLSRLKLGSQFIFSGKRLELVRFHKLCAVVRKATKHLNGSVPSWSGGKMPLSSELSKYVASQITDPDDSVEMNSMKSILNIQSQWSALPSQNYLLIEFTALRGSQNLFFFPFAGRLVHEGLAAIVAYRMTKTTAQSIHVTQNDYGFSLSSSSGLSLDEDQLRYCFSTDGLYEDLEKCMNTAEMARKQFNEIARVAGLIIQQRPGKRKSQGDMQVSSKLLYEVLEKYDPGNLLLVQARKEILSQQLQISRLNKTMQKIQEMPFILKETNRLTPMAFPLWADRLSTYLPAGDAATRLEKMLGYLHRQVAKL